MAADIGWQILVSVTGRCTSTVPLETNDISPVRTYACYSTCLYSSTASFVVQCSAFDIAQGNVEWIGGNARDFMHLGSLEVSDATLERYTHPLSQVCVAAQP